MIASKRINSYIRTGFILLLSFTMVNARAMPPKKNYTTYGNSEAQYQDQEDLELAMALSLSLEDPQIQQQKPQNSGQTNRNHYRSSPDGAYGGTKHNDYRTTPSSSKGTFFDDERYAAWDSTTHKTTGTYGGTTYGDNKPSFFDSPAWMYNGTSYDQSKDDSQFEPAGAYGGTAHNNGIHSPDFFDDDFDAFYESNAGHLFDQSDEEDPYDKSDDDDPFDEEMEEEGNTPNLQPNEKHRKTPDYERGSAIKYAREAIKKAGFTVDRQYRNWEKFPWLSPEVKKTLLGTRVDSFTNTTLNRVRCKHDAVSNYLFGQIITYPVSARLGADWQRLSGSQNTFLLANVALPNIGENENKQKCRDAETFTDRFGGFNDRKFQRSLEEHFVGILRSAENQNVSHFVYITETGQGAFTRYADKHFKHFSKDAVRDAYINGFIGAWRQVKPSFTVYLTGSSRNVAPWGRALSANGISCELKAGGDALMVAQNLANDDPYQTTVLINGANNRGPGNGFIYPNARKAMDENFHRRLTEDAIVAAFIINQGSVRYSYQRKTSLLDHIKHLKRKLQGKLSGKSHHHSHGKSHHSSQGKTHHSSQGKTHHSSQGKSHHHSHGKSHHSSQGKSHHHSHGKSHHHSHRGS